MKYIAFCDGNISYNKPTFPSLLSFSSLITTLTPTPCDLRFQPHSFKSALDI